MAESDNFFSRWSQRKTDVAKGKAVEEPVPPVLAVSTIPLAIPPAAPLRPISTQPEPPVEVPPALTLEDVQALNAESDFSPFAAKSVSPDVRNAAMKKLFTDPHYNVMDGLDIYIDDYSKPDPIPESMLRQMVGAQFLKLFDADPSPNLSTPHAHADLRLQPDHATGTALGPDDSESGGGRTSDPAQRPVPS